MDSASIVIDSYLYWNEAAEQKTVTKAVRDAFFKAKRAGAQMGYTTDGGGVCGMPFTSALIIDVKAKTIYELATAGGEC